MNIIVQTSSFSAITGVLLIGSQRFDCTLGRSGVTLDKKEGDGATPIGTYPLRQMIYRADKIALPQTGLAVEAMLPDTAWCEDAAHADYNTKIKHPHPASTDRMWRDDDLYDIVIVVGYNDDPVIAGKGSAIFIHHARPAFTPTAGCVGLRPEDMLAVAALVDKDSHITVLPPPDSVS